MDFLSFKLIGNGKHIAYVQLGEGVRYCFEDIFEGLRCCFQLFFTLNLRYPEGTEHLWDFLNIAFFNIDTKNIAPFAFTLLTDLNGSDLN